MLGAPADLAKNSRSVTVVIKKLKAILLLASVLPQRKQKRFGCVSAKKPRIRPIVTEVITILNYSASLAWQAATPSLAPFLYIFSASFSLPVFS